MESNSPLTVTLHLDELHLKILYEIKIKDIMYNYVGILYEIKINDLMYNYVGMLWRCVVRLSRQLHVHSRRPKTLD